MTQYGGSFGKYGKSCAVDPTSFLKKTILSPRFLYFFCGKCSVVKALKKWTYRVLVPKTSFVIDNLGNNSILQLGQKLCIVGLSLRKSRP